MKKNKLSIVSLLVLTMFGNTTINRCFASCRTSTLSKECIEIAMKIGPEKMIRLRYNDAMHKGDFTNIRDVNAAQQHIANMYPNRVDLYEQAVCAFGECLKDDGRYDQKQIDNVMEYMMRFSSDCCNRKYVK